MADWGGVPEQTDVSALPRITSPISFKPYGGPCSICGEEALPGVLTGSERAKWPWGCPQSQVHGRVTPGKARCPMDIDEAPTAIDSAVPHPSGVPAPLGLLLASHLPTSPEPQNALRPQHAAQA